MTALRFFLFALPFACGALLPPSAKACSCTPAVTVNQAVPGDGAINVPVNVIPWVRSRAAVKRLDAHGAVVETETERHTPRVNECIFTQELRPFQPLTPNTTYRLQFEPDEITGPGTLTETSFTTGTGRLDSSDEVVELQSTVYEAGRSGCVSKYGACLSMPGLEKNSLTCGCSLRMNS